MDGTEGMLFYVNVGGPRLVIIALFVISHMYTSTIYDIACELSFSPIPCKSFSEAQIVFLGKTQTRTIS